MIKIIDDWYITVELNPTNYVVRRGSGEKDKKGGWIDRPRAYFGSLCNAIKCIRGLIIAEELSGASRTLSEAIRTISEADDRFEKIVSAIDV